MRPGQVTLNEFEEAILERLAQDEPRIDPFIKKLHVLSREFTGAGSYTNFSCESSDAELTEKSISLKQTITIPSTLNGMGAVLFCENNKPKCLETYTFGEELWVGVYEGFSIKENT